MPLAATLAPQVCMFPATCPKLGIGTGKVRGTLALLDHGIVRIVSIVPAWFPRVPRIPATVVSPKAIVRNCLG